jgi:hypothetical protein
VSCCFARWRGDGTGQAIHDLLRWQAREKWGRLADPGMVVLDTQSVHTAAGIPASTTGRDAGKRVPGRKRGLAVDVLGLVAAVVVLAASAHENTAGIALLDRVAGAYAVLGELSLAASSLPQLLAQVSRFLASALASGQLGCDDGTDPVAAVSGAWMFLSDARSAAAALARDLGQAQQQLAAVHGSPEAEDAGEEGAS